MDSHSIGTPCELRERGCGGGVQLPSVSRGDGNVILIPTNEQLRSIPVLTYTYTRLVRINVVLIGFQAEYYFLR